MHIKHLVLAAFIASPFAVVHAQQTTPTAKPSTQSEGGKQATSQSAGQSKVTPADRNFLTQAASDGQKEIELAKIAQQKAGAPAVRMLAERIEKDHMQADQELRKIAQSKSVTLPAADHKADAAKMEKLEGSAFDRNYSNMMVTAHKNAIALFEKGSKSADAEISAFASKTLPTLREHLKMSQEALASSKTSTSGSTAPGSQSTSPGSSPPAGKPSGGATAPGTTSQPK